MTCTFSRSTILKFAALPSDSQPCPRHDEKRWILRFSALRASPAVVLARGSSAVLLSPTHSAPLQRQTASPIKEQRRRIPPVSTAERPHPTPLSIIRTELCAGHHLHYSRPHDDLQHPQLVVALLRGEPQLVIPIELALLAGFFIVRARLSTRPRTSGVNP